MPRRRQNARLQDVAEAAGVSVKTVSNVVNGYVHVKPRTRAKVESALTKLGYVPNHTARGLRTGRSGVVALAVPELDVPYFAELTRYIVGAASEHGWTVLVDQTDAQLEREQLVAQGIRGGLIDGIIFSPLALSSEELGKRRDTTPMVLLGERAIAGPCDHVGIDNVAAARDAVLHLVDIGRRRIAAIGAQPRGMMTAELRMRGYRAGLRRADLPFDRALVARTNLFHRVDGAEAMRKLLSLPEPPDAVVCFNDLLALGAVRVLHEFGLRAPDDVAIVGFDDIEEGRYSVPSLTTIAPSKEQIARVAVSLLADRIAGSRAAPKLVHADYHLEIRESTVSEPTPQRQPMPTSS
jgi:DNA-binding LacI/PurR family transcriptional regulator